MASLTPNTFSSYDLSEAEEREGTMLTITQKQVIQNKISLIAEEKVNLDVDINMKERFLQEEAGLKGQLVSLQYLITCSDAMEDMIKQEATDPTTFE